MFDKNYIMEELGIKFGWLDGEFLPWKDCKIHIYSQVCRYGYRTFEGIWAYWNEDNKKWIVIENSGVDTKNKIVWGNITHLTIFAPRELSEEKDDDQGFEMIFVVPIVVIIVIILGFLFTKRPKVVKNKLEENKGEEIGFFYVRHKNLWMLI